MKTDSYWFEFALMPSTSTPPGTYTNTLEFSVIVNYIDGGWFIDTNIAESSPWHNGDIYSMINGEPFTVKYSELSTIIRRATDELGYTFTEAHKWFDKESGKVLTNQYWDEKSSYRNEPFWVENLRFECYNSEQKPGGPIPMPICLDYEINFSYSVPGAALCPNGMNQTTELSGATKCNTGWLSGRKPTSASTGSDIEPVDSFWITESFLGDNVQWNIEARTKKYPTASWDQLQQAVHFRVTLVSLSEFLDIAKALGLDHFGTYKFK